MKQSSVSSCDRAFGAVYEARFKQTGFVMAVKVIEIGKDTTAIAKEVDLLKRVNHANTVRYYGSCVSGNDIWVLDTHCVTITLRMM